ncbi:MAG: recombination protein RecR [Candidatus Dadabacteria bacterium]|jgi:recombination protein RecR|nr:MAG: recombination protein RecR [Candidatus Dadabacteria bacterium]|tara:strand:+ start:308 stop:901 length:594 start_codon:yes stop_codon:yes gene_type:complete
MNNSEIDNLISLLSRLPGIGPRSARRMALNLLKQPESLMKPLAESLITTANSIMNCNTCGNLDTEEICSICVDERRDISTIIVVEEIADLWALERAAVHKGKYHVLGGTLSAIDGVGPDDLGINSLIQRANDPEVDEIILALNATIDGQTTAYFITDQLKDCNVKVSRLAHGVPVGGELDYMDDGTLQTALQSRQPF